MGDTQVRRKPKDRDFLRTREGMVFCVTGYLHPPDRITAYLKYSPAAEGKWKSGGTSLRRELAHYHVAEVANTTAYLEKHYPQYIHFCPVRDIRFSMIPLNSIEQYYVPEQRLGEILALPQDPLEEEVGELVSDLAALAGVDIGALGITGSILLGIHNPQFSDIDLLVYGLDNALKVRSALKAARLSTIKPLVGKAMEDWSESRIRRFSLNPDEVSYLAERLWNAGNFKGRYFSIHPTRNDDEITENYGDRTYRQQGTAKIRAVVTDAGESLFLPAVYRLENVVVLDGDLEPQQAVLLKQVVSYEGLYCDVVDDGDEIEASGKLESIDNQSYRLVVGTMMLKGKGYICRTPSERE